MTALFIENFDMRQADGGAARLDLGGVHFSLTAPGAFPVKLNPHLLVLARCDADEDGLAALEVIFKRDGEQVARNVQPLSVEPGKFGYNLVQAELEFAEAGTVEAHCRIGEGEPTVVPLTVLEPAADADAGASGAGAASAPPPPAGNADAASSTFTPPADSATA